VETKQVAPGSDGTVDSDTALGELEKDRYGLAIAALMHVKDHPNLKLLKIIPRGGGAAVPLTPQTVINRSYPLIRDAYFYVNRAPGRPLDPIVQAFMRFVLSRQGQEIIAKVNYYYPLDRADLDQQRKKLD